MSDKAGDSGSDRNGGQTERPSGEIDLDGRRRQLEAAIAARRPAKVEENGAGRSGSMAGFGNALKLSSEFIAGIVVGAAIGWVIDHYAGTAPFGLIVFLLLGFVAGVLNALRSAGLVAEVGAPKARDGATDGKEK